MQLPIGISDFRKLIEYRDPITKDAYLCVDKSLFIREIIGDGTEVIVITRPRRFGKTLNLSMLQHFYAAAVDGKPTARLFAGLEISEYPECMQEQGQYPVIFLSFKDAKYNDFASCYEHIKNKISDIYSDYDFLLKNDKLKNKDRIFFEKVLSGSIASTDLDQSLLQLTRILYELTGKQSIILIDEYDTPLQEAYLHGYYEAAVAFMRNLFGSSLKGNAYLKKAVLTGILRISKESLFSSLNNVKIYSVLDEKYANYFGFTETETNWLISKAELTTDAQQTKDWYNGYNFGNTTIYNPWSMIEFIAEKGKVGPYWVNTSGNDLIRKLIINAEPSIKDKIAILMAGHNIPEIVDEHIVFGDLDTNPAALWNLMLMSGYLKSSASRETADGIESDLAIPNKEIELLYKKIIREWLSAARGLVWYRDFLADLANGRAEEFEEKLQTVIEDTLSYHDVTKKAQESFYHGLMLAFVSGLKDTHEIKSNKESGRGRYDVAIIPRDRTKLGVILEFKAVAAEPELAAAATDALAQIKKSRYTAELEALGITKLRRMGIAFCGKAINVIAE